MLRRLTGSDVPTAVYPSDNHEGVPTLRLDMQAGVIDLPFTRWGREIRKSRMRWTWHFYTDDYRFSTVWSRPQVVVNSAGVSAVEANFSVHAQTPYAVALYQTYRKRWLSRMWQDNGIRIWVDLNVAREHRDTNLLGVPRGWRSFATRGSVHKLAEMVEEYEIATLISANQGPVTFLVYGGGRAVQDLFVERGWLWFPEEMSEASAQAAAKRQPVKLVAV